MGRKIEIELKLQILDKAMWENLPKSAWLRGLVVAESAKVETMEATYYDTPLRTLWKTGYAFRVRREGSNWMATLKGAGQSGGGLHQRREWNVPISGQEIDIWKLCYERYQYYENRGERLLIGENIDVAIEDVSREKGIPIEKARGIWKKIEDIKAKRIGEEHTEL